MNNASKATIDSPVEVLRGKLLDEGLKVRSLATWEARDCRWHMWGVSARAEAGATVVLVQHYSNPMSGNGIEAWLPTPLSWDGTVASILERIRGVS